MKMVSVVKNPLHFFLKSKSKPASGTRILGFCAKEGNPELCCSNSVVQRVRMERAYKAKKRGVGENGLGQVTAPCHISIEA